MSIQDIFFSGLSFILGIGIIGGTILFCTFAVAMQNAERAQK